MKYIRERSVFSFWTGIGIEHNFAFSVIFQIWSSSLRFLSEFHLHCFFCLWNMDFWKVRGHFATPLLQLMIWLHVISSVTLTSRSHGKSSGEDFHNYAFIIFGQSFHWSLRLWWVHVRALCHHHPHPVTYFALTLRKASFVFSCAAMISFFKTSFYFKAIQILILPSSQENKPSKPFIRWIFLTPIFSLLPLSILIYW